VAKMPLVQQLLQKSEWDQIEEKALAGDKAMLEPNEYKETALHMCSQPHNPQPKALAALIKLATMDILNMQVTSPTTLLPPPGRLHVLPRSLSLVLPSPAPPR